MLYINARHFTIRIPFANDARAFRRRNVQWLSQYGHHLDQTRKIIREALRSLLLPHVRRQATIAVLKTSSTRHLDFWH